MGSGVDSFRNISSSDSKTMKFTSTYTNPKKFTTISISSWADTYKPIGLTVTRISGGVQLDWTDNGLGYQVYGSLDGITYSLLAGIHVGTNTYSHYIPGGLTMYYKIRTLYGILVSSFSSPVSIYVTDYDAQNIIARMTALSETPSAARQTNIDTTIKALKAQNMYSSQFDDLLITRGHGANSYKLNLINQFETITWDEKRLGTATNYCFYYICELSNGDLLAGEGSASGHYWRSVDGGENWSDEGVICTDASGVYTFCDCGNGIVVCGLVIAPLVGTILRSTDWGHTWVSLGQQYSHHYIPIIKRNETTGILVATTEKSPEPLFANMLRSADNGLTWQECGNGGNDEMTVINMLCYCGGTTWIAGGGKDTGGGVFVDARMIRSTNDGLTWTDLGLDLGGIATQNRYFGSTYLGSDIVLAGTAGPNARLIRSLDKGVTWSDPSFPAGAVVVTGMANCGDGKVLVGTTVSPANGVLFQSDDWGVTWKSLGILEAGYNISDIKILSDGHALILAATDGAAPGKIFKSLVRPFTRSATNTYNATKAGAGTLTHTVDVGIVSDGTTYLKSGFIPGANTKYQLNNCSFGWKESGAVKGSGFSGMGVDPSYSTSTYWYNRIAIPTVAYTSCNGLGTNDNWHLAGYNCLSKLADNEFDKHINADTYHFDVVGAEQVPIREFYFLTTADNNAPADVFMTETIELIWLGKGITQAKFLTLQGILNAYIAAL
jgi:hypothetical protein